MNILQKTLILGIALLLVGTNLTSLVGSNILEKQTYVVTIDDNELSEVRIIINGTRGNNGWYISCVTITITASGDMGIWYRLDGGYWRMYAGPFVVCEEGKHIIDAWGIDQSGNQSTAQAEFKIDQTPPITTHEFEGIIAKYGWFISDVTVTLSAEDKTSGVNYTEYKLNDGEWIVYKGSFVVVEDGIHTLYYYSVDLAGDTEPTNEVEIRIDHDILPPVTTHEFDGIMGDNDWFASNVVVALTAEDDSAYNSGVAYTMYKIEDDTEWQIYTGPFHVTEDGEHTIKYYSVDKVGNREENKSATFKIDKTDPTIDLTTEKICPNTWLLMADVFDETSGIAKVEFYVNGEYVGEVTEPPYEWIYSHRFSVRGLILNPKITEETVSFFAVMAIHSIFNNPVAQAIVYDNAGNEGTSSPHPPINNNRFGIYLFQQLTFQNSYLGYIGKFFIDAVFE